MPRLVGNAHSSQAKTPDEGVRRSVFIGWVGILMAEHLRCVTVLRHGKNSGF